MQRIGARYAPAVVLPAMMVAVGACQSGGKTVATIPYAQDFESGALGPEWSSRAAGWQVVGVVNGRLFNDGAHNVPLWLSAPLPNDVRVTMDAESKSDAVDLKFEIFGDGARHESGYIVILAGWSNSRSIIARLAEHGERHDGVRTPEVTQSLRDEVAKDEAAAARSHRGRRDLVQRSARLQPNRVYKLRFEKEGHDLRFFVDDALHMEYFDPSPLGGHGHDRFAFNNWASQVYFDNLKIEALR
ncbi:MAG: hypothetical protein V3T05_08490 [Myxococcota bacterium]